MKRNVLNRPSSDYIWETQAKMRFTVKQLNLYLHKVTRDRERDIQIFKEM